MADDCVALLIAAKSPKRSRQRLGTRVGIGDFGDETFIFHLAPAVKTVMIFFSDSTSSSQIA